LSKVAFHIILQLRYSGLPTYVVRPLYFFSVFLTIRQTLATPAWWRVATREKSVRSFVLGLTWKSHLDILPTPSLIFFRGGGRGGREVKKWEFCLDFRHQSPLTRFGFEMEQRIGNLKFSPGALMTELRFFWDNSPTLLPIFTEALQFRNEASKI